MRLFATKSPDGRCHGKVWVRDTYRYTGRGDRDGFEMHYNERRCRRSVKDQLFCHQHREPVSLTELPAERKK